ncbi:MAG: 3-oxoacyl-ACP reductase FabG [Theionarchaea archaeon]|nr:3-oxoacyl-ACP reductase FabG [Theionarchaea archaeon]
MRLHNKVALVTGASRGIGRAIALAYAQEGADLIVNYLQSSGDAKTVLEEIYGLGRKALDLKADISDPDEVNCMVERSIETFGRIDILVNNAGILLPFQFENPDFEAWQRMVDVNMKGLLHCSRAVAPIMKEQGKGIIINIVIKETKGSLDYTMTKAAGDIMTRGLARELAPQIRVNAIAPGYIDTGWISGLSLQEQEAIKASIPLKRWGYPEDVANLAVFLASDDSEWMTGTTILLDGGERLGS